MTSTFIDNHRELAWTPAPGKPAGDDPIMDPFIGLEALNDAKVDQWVGAQNDRTKEAFGRTPETDALTARLKAAYTSQERIVSCSRYGDWGYMWTDESFISGERAATQALSHRSS